MRKYFWTGCNTNSKTSKDSTEENTVSGFTAAEIIKGGEALLARNVKADALVSLRERLELINRAYRDVREGDSYTLTYVPGKGTTLRLNGSPLVTVPGHDFAAAYFRIWLGDDPISKSMRDTLLGR